MRNRGVSTYYLVCYRGVSALLPQCWVQKGQTTKNSLNYSKFNIMCSIHNNWIGSCLVGQNIVLIFQFFGFTEKSPKCRYARPYSMMVSISWKLRVYLQSYLWNGPNHDQTALTFSFGHFLSIHAQVFIYLCQRVETRAPT